MFQEELTSRLFHKPIKPPSDGVWLVYLNSFSLSENKFKKNGSGFKPVRNQFAKQMNSLTDEKLNLVSAKQIRPK